MKTNEILASIIAGKGALDIWQMLSFNEKCDLGLSLLLSIEQGKLVPLPDTKTAQGLKKAALHSLNRILFDAYQKGRLEQRKGGGQ